MVGWVADGRGRDKRTQERAHVAAGDIYRLLTGQAEQYGALAAKQLRQSHLLRLAIL
jgi:hypothetical protein